MMAMESAELIRKHGLMEFVSGKVINKKKLVRNRGLTGKTKMMAMESAELIRKHGLMEFYSGKMELGILSPWIGMNSKAKIYGRIQQGAGMIAIKINS
ncbi:hypothetical protein L2E82_27480 [Cichorium intybus]|uniref:Uncharacterized protein n=1 Tax=Cichorium intybus TaxID=13427 RepID=A0ACB9CT79_CICIN|nr:hypothetical protein L2E82_27480 [Cichorium intybus]